MTRDECIALLERYGNYEGMGIPNLVGCKEAMLMAAKLLKPQLPSDDLEKYASRAGFDYVDDIENKYPGHRWNDHDVEFAYRDGIIAGAEWKEEQDDKETADLLAIAHLQGMEQQKKEMMKEVTECELVCFKDHLLAVLPMKEFRWTAGDKVKIIIVKED